MILSEAQNQAIGKALLHSRSRSFLSFLFPFLIMLVLIAGVYLLWIPNPNIILLSGLVICSALYGYPGGITAGLMIFLYSLFFFSTGNDFITFTAQNAQKVLVTSVGILADVFMVCHLKGLEIRAYEKLEQMTMLLQEDNRILSEVSVSDQLTGLGNRFALRRDIAALAGRNVCVMIMDVDNFKAINDGNGHATGDLCLKETGQALSALFGKDHAYRYGGDEFVVLCPDMPEERFKEKAHRLIQNAPVVATEGTMRQTIPLSYSAGYTYGLCQSEEELEKMLQQADEALYRSKAAGKRRLNGDAYRRHYAAV